MHQIDFHNKELDALFEICDTGEKIPSAKEPKSVNAKSDKGGWKSILDKFPDIPVIATDFIKASSFKAQEKRRDTTVTSCGVSIKDAREHLLKVIPGLEEHGISDTTVRYLLKKLKKEHSLQNVVSQLLMPVFQKSITLAIKIILMLIIYLLE